MPRTVPLGLLRARKDSRRMLAIVVHSEELVHRPFPAMEIVLMWEEGDHCYTAGVEYYRSFV